MVEGSGKPIAVGIAGLGRSGWGIHCGIIAPLAGKFTIAAVFDQQPARRQEAEAKFGCATYQDYEQLLADGNVELVVVAMPSSLHAEFSIRALQSGKHVVCEKPMASTLAEADRMIRAARRAGKVLTVFHNHRYDLALRKVQEVIASGKLGRLVEIKVTSQSFGRRWDWQTLQKYGGGSLRNNGSHLLDAILWLLGDAAAGKIEVWSYLDRALTLGDADDHVKVLLLPPGGPLVDLELTSACAYSQEHWLVMGTQGTLAGGRELRWKYFDPTQLPPRQVDEQPTHDRGYNREDIPWREESWQREPQKGPSWNHFYLDLFDTIRSGAPLVVKPEQVRKQMEIIQQCLDRSPFYRAAATPPARSKAARQPRAGRK